MNDILPEKFKFKLDSDPEEIYYASCVGLAHNS